MSERHHWDVRGPVRTVDAHRTWRYWKRGSPESSSCELTENSDHTIVNFRPNGAISRRWHQNCDGSEWTTVHIFDDADRLVSVRNESSSGESNLGLYEYESGGRLLRYFSRATDGSERTLETHSYDAEGRKTKTHFVDLAAQHPNTTYGWGVEGSKVAYSAPNTAKLTTTYDPTGRPTAVLFHDAAGALTSQVSLLYDEFGNLIEESQTHVVSPFSSVEDQGTSEQRQALRGLLSGPISRRVHRYDAFGHCIETLSSTFGTLGSGRETMQYNQYGDLIAQTSEDQSREVGIDDQGRLVDRPAHKTRSEVRFLYEYDARGNWTSKVTEPDTSSIVRRTLTYFNPI